LALLEVLFASPAPLIDLLLGLILRDAVALLHFSYELVALAGNDVQHVVREFPPLLLRLALQLLPVTFYAIPIHGCFSLRLSISLPSLLSAFRPPLRAAGPRGAIPRRANPRWKEKLRCISAGPSPRSHG